MDKVIPAGKMTGRRIDPSGKVTPITVHKLNFKAPVVCASCNNTWMSDLENKHAKPAMTDLMVSLESRTVTPEQLHSIARFAFKTAVVANHMSDSTATFFSTFQRRRFRKALEIPEGVAVFMAASVTPYVKQALFRSTYFKTVNFVNNVDYYVLTWALGYLLLQVVAVKWPILSLGSEGSQGRY